MAVVGCFLLVGVVASMLAYGGTRTTLSGWNHGPGVVAVSVHWRIAFIPAASFTTQATAKDILFATTEQIVPRVDKRTVDIFWTILGGGLLLVRAVPNMWFWVSSSLQCEKQAEQVSTEVTLALHTSGKRHPVPLFTVIAEDFTNLRVSSPPDIKRGIELFTSRIPIGVLGERPAGPCSAPNPVRG